VKIVGLDSLIFGVDDVASCEKCLIDYGLKPDSSTGGGRSFSALDGTSVVIKARNDATLPPPLKSGSMLRETVYGVADDQSLEAIAAELSKDRKVERDADGSVHSVDDADFALCFRRTVRRPFIAGVERVNAPGAPPQREMNSLGVPPNLKATPRTLSHVVYFVPDFEKAEAFYVERLGFRCTDRFAHVGPFLQPPASADHHCLFLIQTPHKLHGIEHFTFHLGGPTEMLFAGSEFMRKGHQSFWGPGRHLFGSNWFWYFDSPFGCHIEYDADMDLHDQQWKARVAPLSTDNTQLFLFKFTEKWVPGGPPAK
jgi:catechol 2,3-dioxygenase-like lactoylglutathione lyase family enzyme